MGARTVYLSLRGNIAGVPKFLNGTDNFALFVGSVAVVNAVRLGLSGAGNITGGSMDVFGLR